MIKESLPPEYGPGNYEGKSEFLGKQILALEGKLHESRMQNIIERNRTRTALRQLEQERIAHSHNKVRMGEAEQLARTDQKTGLLNYLGLQESFKKLARKRPPSCLIFGDIDNFKDINERITHAGGDRILAAVATTLSENSRLSFDTVGRFGGDEFVVMLPKTKLDEALSVATNFDRAISGMPADQTEGLDISMSMSVTAIDFRLDFDEVIAAASEAMLEAKAARRQTLGS